MDVRTNLNFDHSIRTAQELCKDKKEIEYVVKNFIPRKALTGLSGQSGSNKSTLALRLCKAVLTGERFLIYDCVKLNNVLYLNRDDPKGLMQERLSVMGLDRLNGFHCWGLWEDPEPFYLLKRNEDKYMNLANQYDLIIVDSLRFFHPNEEDSSTALQEPLDVLKAMTKVTTVFFLHHSSEKSFSAQKYRGTTLIKDVTSQFYLIEANGDERNLSCIKSKFVLFDQNEFIKIKYEPESYSFECEGKSNRKREELKTIWVIIKRHGPLNQKDIAYHSNLSEKKLRFLLKEGEGELWEATKGKGKELIYRAKNVDEFSL